MRMIFKNPPSVLILVPTMGGGGAERLASYLSLHLKAKKTILLYYPEIVYDYSGEVVVLHRNKKERRGFLKFLYNILPFKKPLRLALNAYKVRKIKSRIKPDVSISFSNETNLANILGSIGEKKILTVHDQNLEIPQDFPWRVIYRVIMRLLYPKADCIVAVSKGVKFNLVKLGIPENKIEVIYNPIDCDYIKKKRTELLDSIFENSEFIVSVGNLRKDKGQWYLLRAFKKVKSFYKNLKLVFIGGVVERRYASYIFRLSKDLGFRTYVWSEGGRISQDFDVYFLGFQNNPFKYVSRAKAFVLPSVYEGFSYVIVEALGCGVPVISADCPFGPREILAPDTDFLKVANGIEFARYGVLTHPFDGKIKTSKDELTYEENMLADAIISLLRDPALVERYRKVAEERASDFNIERIIGKYESIMFT